jgi:DNA polymerase-1
MDVSEQWDVISAIRGGEDVHSATALALFKSTDKEKRKVAKTTNYAVLYGAGIGKIMKTAEVNYSTARELLSLYHQKMYALMAYIRFQHEKIAREMRVITPFGRIRTFPYETSSLEGLTNKEKNGIISKCQREGLNTIFQSMGHDLLLMLWVWLSDRFRKDELLGKGIDFANECHDEIVMDICPDLVEYAGNKCLDGLYELPRLVEAYYGYKLKLPITGKVNYGEFWE